MGKLFFIGETIDGPVETYRHPQIPNSSHPGRHRVVDVHGFRMTVEHVTTGRRLICASLRDESTTEQTELSYG